MGGRLEGIVRSRSSSAVFQSVVVEERDAAFQQALDRAISSAALAVRRSLQRRRLKPLTIGRRSRPFGLG